MSKEPIIDTSLNTQRPCYGSEKESLVLTANQIENIQVSLEKEQMLTACTENAWRSSPSDERYT